MNEISPYHITIPHEFSGWRLDKALAELCPQYSRARLQQWIRLGQVRVNTTCLRGKDKVQGGEHIEINAILEDVVDWQAQSLPLTIVYEDDNLIIVNKPVGLVVHPGAGNPAGTLVNALLDHAPELSQLPRAGIVHRIDKDTSGLLAIARSVTAHHHLVEQLQAHSFLREYQAIITGTPVSGGTIDAPIGRHPVHRTRMAVTMQGKPAITHYRVEQRYRAHTHIRVQLETGRTHQIRVHMAHKHYPLVGDSVYGGRLHFPPHCSDELKQCLQNFKRQALHAATLGLQHPVTNEFMTWSSPIPEDMHTLLTLLAENSS